MIFIVERKGGWWSLIQHALMGIGKTPLVLQKCLHLSNCGCFRQLLNKFSVAYMKLPSEMVEYKGEGRLESERHQENVPIALVTKWL